MKRKLLYGLFAVLVVATIVYAQTVNIFPYGVAIPQLYKYTLSSNTTDSYYMAMPTLSANDTMVGLAATQTLTNKTLTSPTINTPTLATPTITAAQITFKDATIHNFATLAASWTLSASEGLAYFLATTNANGSATVRLPSTAGKKFLFRNGSGQNNVLLPSGAGITVATATALEVYYDSNASEYIKCGTAITAPSP